MAKIEHIKNKRGEVIYPVSKEGAIYDENGVLLSTKIATFITRLVDNLANYYLKSETYTKGEVDELIGAIQGFTYIVVSELPTASAETMGIVYLVPSEDPQTQNVKDEYITIRSGVEGSYTYSWEQIGSTAIDLSGYVTTEALNTALADYTTTANLTTLLAAKQDTIADLSTIRSGAAAGATAYQKPGTGIPTTDMASGVQTSLGKADSAYQKPSGGIPKTDLESSVQGSLELADSAVQADPIGSIVPPVDPSEFATKEEVEGLEAKVDDLSTGKYYGYFAKEEDLPEADVDGFAYVGEGPTYTIYNLRGGVWTSSDITVNQSPVGNEEDIDQNEAGKLQFANRVYNAQQPNGMGYKILRKDATFASQVTDTNTIYEIRYDFNLGGATVAIPSGCVLYFNGGTIKGGTVILGNAILDGFKNVDNSLVISDNTIRREIDTDALGMVRNSSTDAVNNFARLRWGIENGFNINVRGYLYIENTNGLTITNDIVLLGRDASVDVFACGGIDNHSPLYVDSAINNITIKAVGIVNNGAEVVSGGQFIDVNTAQYIKIGAIDFNEVSLSNMRLFRMAGDANNYDASGGNYGFGTLVMKHCNITNAWVILFISDIGYDRAEIAYNNISGLKGIGINASQTNGTTYNNARYGKLLLVHDNFVQNNEVLNNSSAYNCFVLSENDVCHYYRNTVKNIFNIYNGDPATYDAYLSSGTVFYEGNIVHNVGSLYGTYQDIFKAKAGSGPRYFTNNRFTFSAAELITKGWITSGQESGLKKTLFNAQSVTGNVDISKNYINIDIPLSCVNIGYCDKATFCYNTIHAKSLTSGTLAYGNASVPSQVFEIAYNTISIDSHSGIIAMFRLIQSSSSVVIHDNDFTDVCYAENDSGLGSADYTKIRSFNNYLTFIGNPGYTSAFGIIRSDIVKGYFAPRLNLKCDAEWRFINQSSTVRFVHTSASTILKVYMRGGEEYYIFDYQNPTRTIYTSLGEKTTTVPKTMDDFTCQKDELVRNTNVPLAEKYHFVVTDIPADGIETVMNREFYYTREVSVNSGWNAIQNYNRLDSTFRMAYLKTLVTDQGKIYSKIGENLTELDGAAKGVVRHGASTDRPTSASVYAGFVYFDETLGKPIWNTGSGWVDATGTTV